MKDGAGKNRILFSNANSMEERKGMTVKISYDEGKTWPEQKTIYTGSTAYSSLMCFRTVISLYFSKKTTTRRMFLFPSLEWLTGGKGQVRRIAKIISTNKM
ncbi:hypothetical protein BH20BAC1_BH20BAC1_01650 [soil metagenome]